MKCGLVASLANSFGRFVGMGLIVSASVGSTAVYAQAAQQPSVISANADVSSGTLTLQGTGFGTSPRMFAAFGGFRELVVQTASPTQVVAGLGGTVGPGTDLVLLRNGTSGLWGSFYVTIVGPPPIKSAILRSSIVIPGPDGGGITYWSAGPVLTVTPAQSGSASLMFDGQYIFVNQDASLVEIGIYHSNSAVQPDPSTLFTSSRQLAWEIGGTPSGPPGNLSFAVSDVFPVTAGTTYFIWVGIRSSYSWGGSILGTYGNDPARAILTATLHSSSGL